MDAMVEARCDETFLAMPTWAVITGAKRYDNKLNGDSAVMQFDGGPRADLSCSDARLLYIQDSNLQTAELRFSQLHNMFNALICPTDTEYDIDAIEEPICKEAGCILHGYAENWNEDIGPCTTTASPAGHELDFSYMDFEWTEPPEAPGSPLSMLIYAYGGHGDAGSPHFVQHSSLGGPDVLLAMLPKTEGIQETGSCEGHGEPSEAGGVAELICAVGDEAPALIRTDLIPDARTLVGCPGPIHQAFNKLNTGIDVRRGVQDSSTLGRYDFQPDDQPPAPDARSPAELKRKRKSRARDAGLVIEGRGSLLEGLATESHEQAQPVAPLCRARQDHHDIDMNVRYTEDDEDDNVTQLCKRIHLGASPELDMGSYDPLNTVHIAQENTIESSSSIGGEVQQICTEDISASGHGEPDCVSAEGVEGIVAGDEALIKMMGWFPVETNFDQEIQSTVSVHWVVDEAPFESDLPHLELLENSPTKFWGLNPESTNRPPIQISYLHCEPSQSSHSVQFFLNDSPASSPEVKKKTPGSRESHEEVSPPGLHPRRSSSGGNDTHVIAQRNSTAFTGAELDGWASSSTRRESIETNLEAHIDFHEKSAEIQFFLEDIPALTTEYDRKPTGSDLEETSPKNLSSQVQAEGHWGMRTMQEDGHSTFSDTTFCRILPPFEKKPDPHLRDSLEAATTAVQDPIQSSRDDVICRETATSSCSVQCQINDACTLPADETQLNSTPPCTQPGGNSPTTGNPGAPPGGVEINIMTKRVVPASPLSDISNRQNLVATLRESFEKKLESRLEVATECKHLVPELAHHSSPVNPPVSMFDTKVKSTLPRSKIRKTPKGTRVELPIYSRKTTPLQPEKKTDVKDCPEVRNYVRCHRKTQGAGDKDEVESKDEDEALSPASRKADSDCEGGSRKKVSTTQTSKFRGVTRHRHTGRFEAHLWDNSKLKLGLAKRGRQVYLGAYQNEVDAAQAHDLAALKYWGPGIHTNFPISLYKEELKAMQDLTREEYILLLRRKSPGFTRGVSKYRGVTRHHQDGRWEARIGRHSGAKYHYLGTYATQEEAAIAYDKAAVIYRGASAVTNFDISDYLPGGQPKSATAIPTAFALENTVRKSERKQNPPVSFATTISRPSARPHAPPKGQGKTG